VIPALDGTAVLNVIPDPAAIAATGTINVGSTVVAQNGVINIENGNTVPPGNGFSALRMGQNANGVQLTVSGSTNTLVVEDKVALNNYLVVDALANNVVLGASSAIVGVAAGTVTVEQPLLVRDASLANAVGIAPTSATASVIAQTIASGGTLNLGSSAAAVDTLSLHDGGADTGYALVGGNGGENIYMAGGSGSFEANIRTDYANNGFLTLGSSVANPQTVFIRDGLTANTGYVDVAGGIAASIALRLQGANTLVGANNAYVSTNLSTGNSAAQLNLSSAFDDVPAAVQITSSVVKINRPITGNTVNQSSSIAALGDGGSSVIPSSGSPSITEGLWAIVANNVAQDGQIGTQVSCIGYFSDAISPGEWILGGNGFGQALTNPTRNFAIQPTTGYQTLTFLNTSGFNMTGAVKVYFIRLTGALGI
jgi:hypothetical protein